MQQDGTVLRIVNYGEVNGRKNVICIYQKSSRLTIVLISVKERLRFQRFMKGQMQERSKESIKTEQEMRHHGK